MFILVLSFVDSWFVVLQVRAMECIRQLLLRSGEALFLLQLVSQHHVTRLVQGFDANLRQALVQLTFHQLVCSDEGDRLATRLISALMEVIQVQIKLIKEAPFKQAVILTNKIVFSSDMFSC